MAISKEYGEAIFALAMENNALDEYGEALDTISAAFNDAPDYVSLLASPSVPKSERINAIQAAFASLPEHIVSFTSLLCERGRIREFNECVKEYKALCDASRQLSTAIVTSSVELTENEKQKLTDKLEKRAGKSVLAEYRIDKSLIGGLIIEMDGTVLDGSIKSRLKEVKEVISR